MMEQRASGTDPSATVSIETVSSLNDIAALRPDYERLRLATGNALPFALHEWHMTWCSHFLNRDPRIEDEALFYVMRTAARECVAIIPLIVSRHRVGPMRMVSGCLLGADPAITEIRGPLIEAGYERLAASAVHDHLAHYVDDWDWIHWSGINSAFASGLGRGGTLDWQPALSAYVLDLPACWEEFRKGFKRNIRESLPHCYTSLRRSGLRFELQVAARPSEVRQGLDRFFELHAKRASLKGWVQHPNRFACERLRHFLVAVCECLAARGAVRLFQLKIGAEIVAMRLGFVVGDSLYLYYSGFNPAWASYNVMTTTVAEAIRYAISHGLKTVNLACGTDVFKKRWGPRAVEYRAAYQHNGRLRSHWAQHAYLKAVSGEGLQGQLLQRLVPAARPHWN